MLRVTAMLTQRGGRQKVLVMAPEEPALWAVTSQSHL